MRNSRLENLNPQGFKLEFFDQTIDAQRLKTIVIDNIGKGKYPQTIPNTFKVLDLIEKYQQTKDVALENLIKSSFQNSLLDGRMSLQIIQSPVEIVNPTKPFLIRKVGNMTSQEVERDCKFTKDGIVQIKQNKPLKIKSVVKMEEKDKGKMSDIAWTKDVKKYPFRVVMKDQKNLLRAVFTQTNQQAIQIMDYCVIHIPTLLTLDKSVRRFSDNLRKAISKVIADKIGSFSRAVTTASQRKSIKSPVGSIQKVELSKEELFQIEKRRVQAVQKFLLKNNDGLIVSKAGKDWQYVSSAKKARNNDFQFVPPKRIIPTTPTRTKQQPMDFVQNFTLIFQKVELLKQNNLMRKPILDIKIVKGGNQVYKRTYETILEKKEPHLIYLLHSDNYQSKQINFEDQFNKLEIQVVVSDRLISQQTTASLRLRVKERVNQLLYLASEDGSIRLQIRYITDDKVKNQIKENLVNEDGLVLIYQQLKQQDIQKMQEKYWHAENKNYLNITQILGRFEVIPKFWWFGVTEEEYQILSFLQLASQSLSFLLIQSHLHIVRALMKIFHNSDQMIQRVFKSALSIIIYYLKPYYFRTQFNVVQKIHAFIGIDVNCDLPFKISLEISALNQILKLQVPRVVEKYKHKNVHLGLICFQYLYELYSRNFNIRLLASLWNYLFKFHQNIQINLLLMSVVMIKINEESLLKVYRYPEIISVLTEKGKQFTNFNYVISQLEDLRKKYFTKPDNMIDTIKSKLLNDNPFQRVAHSFYKKQNVRLENNLSKKTVEKKKILERLVEQKHQFIIPKYEAKSQNLHIYFHKLPNITGSYFLSLRINNIDHECIKAKADTYYIVKKVNSPVQIVLTYQGKRWSNTAQLIQGVHCASIQLEEEKNAESVMTIQYTAGFLTQSQQVAIVKGKPSDHYLGSYMKLQSIIGECSRQVTQCYFLQKLSQKRKIPYDIVQGIKVLFTSGGNRFNDVDFYLGWIHQLKISPLQKIQKLKTYCESLWTELFHSPSYQLYKIMFREYLDKMNFPIEDGEFEFLYNGQFAEFDCPRVISAKFTNKNGKKVRLDQYLQRFVSEKSSKYLYSDIIASQKYLFNLIHKALQDQNMKQFDGVLILKYSSYGVVKKRLIPLRFFKNQLIVDTQNQQYQPNQYQIKDVVPELLGAQSYPSFSKITRRHFNQEDQKQTIKKKYEQNQKNNFQEGTSTKTMNVLSCLEEKLKSVIKLRYTKDQYTTNIPFLSYFSELLYKIVYPVLPKLSLNNIEVPANKICTFNGQLDLSDNQRGEDIKANKRLGLHGNISKWNFQTPMVYFWSQKNEQSFKSLYPVFVNYGQGVFRTEQCTVDGYCRGIKNSEKIYFIIELQGKKILIPREQLLIQNINLFTKVDLQTEKYQSFKKVMKEYEGKTRDEKASQTAESQKFTNLMKKDNGFYEPKNLKTYTSTFDRI